MGCGEFIVKYILFFANLFFALAGLLLLGIGVGIQLKISHVTDVMDSSNIQIAPITAMVIGGIVFTVAFFGCCGAIRESNCMLVTYAVFMIILMILKIALATMIFVNLKEVLDSIPEVLNSSFSKDPTAFQALESTFQCCGPRGAISYLTNPLPDTCCETAPCNLLNAYGGCNSKVYDFMNTFGLTIGIVAICVGAIELVAVVFSLCLANHVRNRDRRTRY